MPGSHEHVGVSAGAQTRPLGHPAPAPAQRGEFAFLHTQPGQPDQPVAYDPCRPIRVVVNNAEAPPGADRLLDEAIDTVSAATGLQFAIDGETDERPTLGRRPTDPDRYGDGWSPVLVAWTAPAVVSRLRGTTTGLAGSSVHPDGDRLVTGIVLLDGPEVRAALALDGRSAARAVIVHELGHLVGLDHVDDPRQLMHAKGTPGVTSLGAGDRHGLRALGLGRCFLDD
ncbi:MAG: matrixin family metalloprotease [Nocardioidaceae bacterium]